MVITKLGEPSPTLGDDLAYNTCYYENVPEEYRIGSLIRSDPRYPLTKEILPYLVWNAHMAYTGWEIRGRTFEDFGQRIKYHYNINAAVLELYIGTIADIGKIPLKTTTKNIIGKGKTKVTNDTTNKTDNKNVQTLDTTDINNTNSTTTITTDGTLHSTNKSEGEAGGGPVGFAQGEKVYYKPTEQGTNKNSITNDGHTKNTNHSTVWADNDTCHIGTVKNDTDGTLHVSGTNTTETDERISTIESIVPGVVIAELAKIPGIMSPEKYFINILKPCFTLHRWITW